MKILDLIGLEYLVDKIANLLTGKANVSDLSSHTSNTSNPHSVTLGQLGITASVAEVNKLDGVTASTAELNFVDGVTSNIQTQLNAKVPTSRTINSKALSSNITLNATDVGAEPSGTSSSQVSAHNSSTSAHNDIRTEISDLSNEVSALGDSKVGFSDIINNLTTNDSTKPLSAAQGYALKNSLSALDSEVETKAESSDLTSHTSNAENPHNVSLSQLGVAATVEEVNKLAGLTASTDELNYLDGVTAKVQTQLNAKVPTTRTVNGKALSSNITLSASDVSADASGTAASTVSVHNTSTSAHNDIRELIDGLTTRLNTLADSDDATLDQMSEIVEYIKSNKSLIDSVTSSKVNVSDIVNNLTTNTSNKPLSAAQGVALKSLIDTLQSSVNTKAAASDLTSHTGNSTVHITATERTDWNAAKAHAAADHAPSNAQANQNAFSNIVVGNTTISADSTMDSFTLSAGSNVTLTPDASNDSIIIAAKDTVYTHPSYTSKSNALYKVGVDGTGHVSSTAAVTKADITALGIPAQDTVYSHPNYTAKSSGLYKVTVDDTGHVSAATAVAKSDITGLGIPAQDTVYTHPTHTAKSSGLYKVTVDGSGHVSAATAVAKSDITALGIPAQDTVYTHPSYTARTGVPTANQTPGFGETFSVSQPSANATGHITALTSRTITMPSATATTAAAGLMSSTDKAKSDATNVAFGTCTTAAATAAKEITITGNTNWKLAAGSIIIVKFSYTNTASDPTFNVNGTGAKSIWYNTALVSSSNLNCAGYANRYGEYAYDGTQFVFIGWSVDSNTTYSNASLGQGYGTCATAAATAAKVVSLSGYTLTKGGVISVKFTYAVPANATMNINSKGAKNIYYRGSAIAAGIIEAGDIATFIYDGTQYHLLTVDRHRFFTMLVPYGIPITTEETNLNTVEFLKVGNYYCSANATAKTFANCPTELAFMMQVYSPLSTSIDNETSKAYIYRVRKLLTYKGDEYVQYCSVSATAGVWTYGAWEKIITAADTATSSSAGLMTAAQYNKLAGIAEGANAYTLPTASSSTLGGVKTTSTVTSTSGLTACPIISGVPYYKDTNTTYTLPTASSSTLGGVKTTSTVTSTSGLTACPIISGVPYYKDTDTTYTLSSFGITATAAEINKLDGLTATTTELNYVDGVTSSIQTQLNGKVPTTRTVNSKALSANITLSASDVGALPIVNAASMDMDDIIASGTHLAIYSATNATGGTPYAEGVTGYASSAILSYGSSANNAIEIAFSSGTRKIFARQRSGGTNSEWSALMFEDNIIYSADTPAYVAGRIWLKPVS